MKHSGANCAPPIVVDTPTATNNNNTDPYLINIGYDPLSGSSLVIKLPPGSRKIVDDDSVENRDGKIWFVSAMSSSTPGKYQIERNQVVSLGLDKFRLVIPGDDSSSQVEPNQDQKNLITESQDFKQVYSHISLYLAPLLSEKRLRAVVERAEKLCREGARNVRVIIPSGPSDVEDEELLFVSIPEWVKKHPLRDDKSPRDVMRSGKPLVAGSRVNSTTSSGDEDVKEMGGIVASTLLDSLLLKISDIESKNLKMGKYLEKNRRILTLINKSN